MKNTNRQNIKFPQDKDLGRQISEEFYKTTFIRDPLDRLFSAYRDKFTGTLDHSSGKHDQCFYNFWNARARRGTFRPVESQNRVFLVSYRGEGHLPVQCTQYQMVFTGSKILFLATVIAFWNLENSGNNTATNVNSNRD